MGSDLGHDEDTSNQLFRNNTWSKKEKEFLRLLLSNQTGSIIMVIFIELMIYHYTVSAIYFLIIFLEFDLLISYKSTSSWHAVVLFD